MWQESPEYTESKKHVIGTCQTSRTGHFSKTCVYQILHEKWILHKWLVVFWKMLDIFEILDNFILLSNDVYHFTQLFLKYWSSK